MKTVLMVAYHFPPSGGAGVQRTLKFVKYLPEMDWQPLVLTVEPGKRQTQDPSLLEEIPAQVQVLRTSAVRVSPTLPFRIRHWIRRWLLLVDEQIGWMPYAASAGVRLIARHHPEAIYSTSSPYTCHLIALRLKKSSRLPWVADFRDPWVAGFSDDFPTQLHRRFALALEAQIFEQSDSVILNTQRALEFYASRYPYLPEGRLIFIPNGFDIHDLEVTPYPSLTKNPPFTLVHTGNLYQTTRSGRTLVMAVRKLVESMRLPAGSISLNFYGNLDSDTLQQITSQQSGGLFRHHGYVSHRESLQALITANLLVLIPSTGSGSDLYIPAKLYEYLAAGKPILALAEPGAAADLIRDLSAGSVVSPEDVVAVADAIYEYYTRWQIGQAEPSLNPASLARYERRELTHHLVQVLDRISRGNA